MQGNLRRRYSPKVAICLALASVPFVGCNRAEPAKTHTIGVVQYDPILSPSSRASRPRWSHSAMSKGRM
jgi:hypothetical protein